MNAQIVTVSGITYRATPWIVREDGVQLYDLVKLGRSGRPLKQSRPGYELGGRWVLGAWARI